MSNIIPLSYIGITLVIVCIVLAILLSVLFTLFKANDNLLGKLDMATTMLLRLIMLVGILCVMGFAIILILEVYKDFNGLLITN